MTAARDVDDSGSAELRFGNYRVIEKLGEGGMGTVYLARQEGGGLDRLAVVKAVRAKLLDEPEVVERFTQEARVNARLSHPNIVQVYELGDVDGLPYVAMEHVHGRSFDQIIAAARARGETLPLEVILRVCCDLLRALALDHQPVGNTRRLLAGAAVSVNLAVAQFPHIAQHRNARPVAEQRQHVECGADRGRTCVHCVVQDQCVMPGGERAQMAGLWFHIGQGSDSVTGRYTEPGAHGYSGQQQRHVVTTKKRCDHHARQLEVIALQSGAEPVVHQVEGNTLCRDGDVSGLQMGARIFTDGHYDSACPFSQNRCQRIIAVENCQAIGRQRLQ